MIKVLRDIESPPGGWNLTVPQTGVTLNAPYARSLRNKVIAHLEANGHEINGDFEEWFEDAACRENGFGEPFCGQPIKTLTRSQKLITPSKAKRFLRTMLGVLQDRKLVSKEEARRRQAICLNCPLAGQIGACWGCYAIYRQIRRWFQKDPNPVEFPKDKQFCIACGCLLKVKVLIPNETLDRAEEGDRPEYAEGCWRNEDSTT